jgi:hypothetical protein
MIPRFLRGLRDQCQASTVADPVLLDDVEPESGAGLAEMRGREGCRVSLGARIGGTTVAARSGSRSMAFAFTCYTFWPSLDPQAADNVRRGAGADTADGDVRGQHTV